MDIQTDHSRLLQVLANLMSNAMKFTFTGGVKVVLSIDPTDSRALRISVEDTGIGIKPKDQKKLFSSFEKLALSRRDATINAQGLGLGLMISYSIVQKLGPKKEEENKILVQSVVDQGSKFYFSVLDHSQVSAPESSGLGDHIETRG
mmetsp:Transcript_3444/g.3003  ORF Transcript_3444/g.3003 Transcript_3444/m.3003 type:complete len:147 (-) Transcript_3444:748-1188(-)